MPDSPETTDPEVHISISCSTCDRADPHVTRGCDAAGCTWREEYVHEILQAGGELHVGDAKVTDDGVVSISLRAWPKVQGNG